MEDLRKLSCIWIVEFLFEPCELHSLKFQVQLSSDLGDASNRVENMEWFTVISEYEV